MILVPFDRVTILNDLLAGLYLLVKVFMTISSGLNPSQANGSPGVFGNVVVSGVQYSVMLSGTIITLIVMMSFGCSGSRLGPEHIFGHSRVCYMR